MSNQYQEYREAYDKHACLGAICEETTAEHTKVIEDSKTGISMMTEGGQLTGEQLCNIGQTVLMIISFSDLLKASFKDSELSIRTATLGLAKLCLFTKVETSQEDVAEAQDELEKGIWFTNQASQEVRALRALFKEEVATLYELLKL